LSALVRGPVLLDLVQQLGALGSPVVDEGLDVLLQTLYRLFHLLVPRLRTLQAGFQVQEFLVCPLVLGDDCASLSLERLIFALLCPDSLVLQKAVERHRQLSHQGCLLMGRLNKTVLIRPVFLELLLEQLLLVVGDRLLVQNQNL
jgi:hypothetical protein